jgi:GPH family glycoside/pentoside/hexuronide:cation symporter
MPEPSAAQVPLADKLAPPSIPTRKRFLWGIGGFTDTTIYSGINGLTQQVWVNARGMDPVLFSIASALPNFLAFLTNPIIGHLSDNTRSRWGRRRPWMLAGVLIAAVIAILMWFPPAFTPVAKGTPWTEALSLQWAGLLFLSFMMAAVFTGGYAVFTIAHTGLGYEMTSDYDERTHLFKWRMLAASAAGFLSPWFVKFSLMLEGDKADTIMGAQGVQVVGFIIAGIILVTGLCPVIFCRENVAAHAGEAKVPFFRAVRLTLKNRPFWLLVVSNFITKFGMSITGVFFLYVFIYHLGNGSASTGATYWPLFANAINITSFIAMGLVATLTVRIGKKASLIGCLIMSTAAYGSIWFTLSNSPAGYVDIPLPWGAAGNSLLLQWPCLITAVLIGAFTNTMPMIKNSMVADVCDLDELNSGHRQEAFYGAVFVTTDKIAMATAMMFQGVMLKLSGFDVGLTTQSAETVRYWLLALVMTQPLGFLFSIVAILYYPITRARSLAIRSELEARKPRAAPAAI